MPSGCQFICKNKECECFDSGFVLSGYWPMVNINKLIALEKGNKKVCEPLKQMRNNGKKYGCLILPDDNHIEPEAYRAQYWSEESKTVWEFDVVLNGQTLEEALENWEEPKVCPQTGGELKSFVDCVADGIECPYCGQKLFQSRWFAIEN